MAWIESHQTLAGHPKTRKLALLLGISKPAAIGHLHCFWWWALDYSDDGSLEDHEPIDIAIGAEWDGDPDAFVDAMVRVGFIDRADDECLSVHDWDDYGGKLTRARKAHAEKQRKRRAESGGGTDTARDRNVPRTDSARASLQYTTQENTTQEDKKGAAAPGYTDDFLTFWKAFPSGKGNKKKSFDQWKRLKPDAELQAVILDRIEAWKRTRQWRDGFITHAERWLRDRGWEDDLPNDAPSITVHRGGQLDDEIPDNIIGPERRRLVREKWMRDNPEEAAKFIRENPERARELGMVQP